MREIDAIYMKDFGKVLQCIQRLDNIRRVLKGNTAQPSHS